MTEYTPEDRERIKRSLKMAGEHADKEVNDLLIEAGADPDDPEIRVDLAEATDERDALQSLADRI